MIPHHQLMLVDANLTVAALKNAFTAILVIVGTL